MSVKKGMVMFLAFKRCKMLSNFEVVLLHLRRRRKAAGRKKLFFILANPGVYISEQGLSF